MKKLIFYKIKSYHQFEYGSLRHCTYKVYHVGQVDEFNYSPSLLINHSKQWDFNQSSTWLRLINLSILAESSKWLVNCRHISWFQFGKLNNFRISCIMRTVDESWLGFNQAVLFEHPEWWNCHRNHRNSELMKADFHAY